MSETRQSERLPPSGRDGSSLGRGAAEGQGASQSSPSPRRPSCSDHPSDSPVPDLDVVDCHCSEPLASLDVHMSTHSPPTPGSPSPYGLGSRHSPRVGTRPKRIIIVRHGESLGNVSEEVYSTTPDWKVPLSMKGHEQAKSTGRRIKELIGDEPLYIYTSPYVRTKQTLANMLESLEGNVKVGIREEPRITEQQFGNFQHPERMVTSKRDREQFGRFYYRFPEGESGLDVYTRVTSFISTMFRDFGDAHICRPDLNVIIVTHGLTLRLLLMRWFKFTVDTFEATTNPSNGAFVVMQRRESTQRGGGYELSPESAEIISLQCSSAIPLSRRKSSSSLLLQQQQLGLALGLEALALGQDQACIGAEEHEHEHEHEHV